MSKNAQKWPENTYFMHVLIYLQMYNIESVNSTILAYFYTKINNI